MESNNMEKMFCFLHQVGKLKDTYRFSQVETLKNTESTADHSWRLSLMAFIVADELKLDINVERAVRIAIVHDIIESVTGDVDYRLIVENKVTKEEKKNKMN